VAILEQGDKGRKCLLLVNKKKQKNFIHGARARGREPGSKQTKVFLLLFLQKKKNPSFPVGAANRPR
jgi:hypothetical protein